jgi:NAD(P)-dependent dehydrogenase (short-subunit alcohol dehydrogenase family)
MDLELNDKVAVVTGASTGIGLPIVKQLAAEASPSSAGRERSPRWRESSA